MTGAAWFFNVVPRPIGRRLVHRFWKLQEPELARIDEFVDGTRGAVDVGAWWGPWTAALAKRCPEVHAFEPQPQLAADLRRWAPPNVTIHETALAAEAGSGSLQRPNDRAGADALASLRPIESSESVPVEVRRLDDLGFRDVGFLKIDVEGLELDVLRGAASTIATSQPRIMIEIEQRHLDGAIDVVFDWFRDQGYRGHFVRGRGWATLDEFDVQRDQLDALDHLRRRSYVNAFLFIAADDTWAPR